jgi:hypothetical protein
VPVLGNALTLQQYLPPLASTAASTGARGIPFDSPHFSASNEPLSAQIRAVPTVLCAITLPELPRLSLGSISARARQIHLIKIW